MNPNYNIYRVSNGTDVCLSTRLVDVRNFIVQHLNLDTEYEEGTFFFRIEVIRKQDVR